MDILKNIKILKKIKRENEILDKKRELLKKEAQKVKAIRSNIKDSARDIASTIRNSQVNYYGSGDKADSNLNPEYPTDSLNITDNEEELKKLATILCAAMDDYREQKETEEGSPHYRPRAYDMHRYNRRCGARALRRVP